MSIVAREETASPSNANSRARRYALAIDGREPTELPGELSAAPQTIGGGPRCSLRLDGAGLRPLHCVVTYTEQGPTVRRWAVETLLNGSPFSEAPLNSGDLLSVGSIDLRVVELTQGDTEEPVQAHQEAATQTEPDTTSEPEGWLLVEAGKELGVAKPIEPSDAPVGLDPEPSPEPSPLESFPAEAEAVEPEAELEPEQDEWFDDSVDQLSLEPVAAPPAGPAEQQPSPPGTPQDKVDPAVPQRLLQNWGAADGTETPAAKRDTAGAAVLFETDKPSAPTADEEVDAAPLADNEIVDSSARDETPGGSDLDNEWAIEAAAPSAAESIAAEPVVEAPVASGDWAASLAEANEEESVDAWETPSDAFHVNELAADAADAAAPAESASPSIERLRQRLATRRRRVTSLIRALRAERAEREAACEALAERDAQLDELRLRVEEVATAHEAAQAELAQVDELSQRLSDAEATAADAAAHAEALEAELRELHETLELAAPAEPMPVSVESPAEETPSASEEVAVEAAVEPETATADPWLAEPASGAIAEATSDAPAQALLEQPALEPTPASDAAPLQYEAPVVEHDEVPVVEHDEEPVAEAAGGDAEPNAELWGIERLPTATAEQPDESPWGATPEAEAIESTAAEEVDEVDAEAAFTGSLSADDPLLAEPSPPLAGADESIGLLDEFLKESAPAAESPTEAPADEPSEAPAPAEPAPAESLAQPEPEPVAELEPPTAEEAAEAEATETDAAEEDAADSGSFIDRYAKLLPADDEPVEASTQEIAEPTPEPLAPAYEASDNGDEDESIDDYMQKLMSRMRGEAEPPAVAKSPSVVKPAAPAPSAPAAKPVAEEPKPAKPILSLDELKAGAKPATQTDIGALRQLANQSARTAIDVAATRQGREQATLRLAMAATALGCGAGACILAPTVLGAQFLIGAVAVTGGAYYTLHEVRAYEGTKRKRPAVGDG